MAYNSFYPATYQPQSMYQQNYSPNMQNQNTNSLIWVQGEAAAKSYLVAPNTSIALWDSEQQTVYIKSADASGMPSMKVLDYTIRENTQNRRSNGDQAELNNLSTYATKSEISAISDRINAIQSELDKLTGKKGKTDE